ncbi:MAG: leucine-rich repeat protein [Clostridia bacterium]
METQEKYIQWYVHLGKLILLLTLIVMSGILAGCNNGNTASPTQNEFIYDIADSKVTITGYNGYSDTVTIPEYFENYPVTGIAAEVFKDHAELVDIRIPDTVSYIGHYAFKGTAWYDALDSDYEIVGDAVLVKYSGADMRVIIPENIKHISACAFMGREDIVGIKLHEEITRIEDHSFSGCSKLSEVTDIEQVTYIGQSAFEGTNIYEFIIPSEVNVIRERTFYNCHNLTQLYLHENIEIIEDDAFGNCTGLGSVRITGSDNSQIDYQYGLQGTVVLPMAIKSIGKDIFKGADSIKSISTITIKEGVGSITSEYFKYIVEPKNIYIPASVTFIDEGIFSGFPDVMLLVYEDSYAMEYAENNGIDHVIRPSPFADQLFEKLIMAAFYAKGWEFTYENMLMVEKLLIYPDYMSENDILLTDYKIGLNSDNFIAFVEFDGTNRINTLNDMKYFTNVTDLEIDAVTNISDISTLSYCDTLKILWINNAKIKDIRRISDLKVLTDISLSNNLIEDFTVLQSFPYLINLHLEGMNISDISFLSGLVNLKLLDLRNNNIKDISVLALLDKLKSLYLDNNDISDVSALVNLPLTNFSIENNPISR